METAAAVLMVFFTAVRSLFGQEKIEEGVREAPLAQQYVNTDVMDTDGSHGYRGRNDDTV